MKNSELYHRTVDILAKAYIDNTLFKGNCAACAVGNIIAGNCNIHYVPVEADLPGNIYWAFGTPCWQIVFCTRDTEQRIDTSEYRGTAKLQIDATDYSWEDLAKIERAFEGSYDGDDPMYSSLMACIKAMDEIHEVTDESITSRSRDKFVKV